MNDPQQSQLRSALVAGAAHANRRRRQRVVLLGAAGAIALVAGIGWAATRPADQVPVVDPAGPASVSVPRPTVEPAIGTECGDVERPGTDSGTSRINADVDGDGDVDAVWVEWEGEQSVLVVQEPSGEQRAIDLPPPLMVEVLGAGDLDGTGADELFLRAAGNTVDPVAIGRIDDRCSFAIVPAEDDGADLALSVDARSSGVPGGLEAIRCDAGDDGVIVYQISTRREVPDRNGDGRVDVEDLTPEDPYVWTWTGFRVGDELVVVETDSGRSNFADPAIPLANDFDCDL